MHRQRQTPLLQTQPWHRTQQMEYSIPHVNKTKYWVITQDSIQNLQQPKLELTHNYNAFVHVNKNLSRCRSLTAFACDTLLSRCCYIASNIQSNITTIRAIAAFIKVTSDAFCSTQHPTALKTCCSVQTPTGFLRCLAVLCLAPMKVSMAPEVP
jgi:hypothetical protein